MTTDLYAILEVERGASARQIRSAYRRLARTYHPDRNANDDAGQRFKAIAEAYSVLSDTSRRAIYDQWGYLPSTTAIAIQDEENAFE
jgi:DnaJ-class molecular chaperone